MSAARAVRLVLVIILLAVALVFVWRTKIDPNRVSLFVTAVIGSVTTIYALFTYEILLENRATAKAATDSSMLMERGLRFAHTPNLLYETINTKNPTFPSGNPKPIDNDDYKRALAEFSTAGEKEFVFAVVHNKGQGAASNLRIEATYRITDSSNPNRESTVTKRAAVQVLDPGKEVALCIFISKVPTSDDQVVLVSANLIASDFYRDALKEPPQQLDIDIQTHHVDSELGTAVRLA